MITIFAYGSNMNLNRLKERTPSAGKIANAFLPNYRFACNKLSARDGSAKCNIMPDSLGTGVLGVLYEISDSEKQDLDRAEGKGNGYSEHTIFVFDVDLNTHIAVAYIADDGATQEGIKAFDLYKTFVVTGAQQNKLPDMYIQLLNAIKEEVDPDENRRKKNLDII